MKPPLSYVPALPVVTGLGAGILFAVYFTCAAWIVAAVLLMISLVLWLTKHSWGGVLCFFVAAGVAVTMLRMPNQLPASFDGQKCTAQCKVMRATETPETMRYLVKVTKLDNLECDFYANITAYSVSKPFSAGDEIKVTGRIYSNTQYLDVPDQVDYSRYAFIDGVVARMGVHHDDITYVKSSPTWLQTLYNKGSLKLGNDIVLSGFDSKTSAFLLATIAGDDLYLSEQLSEDFRAIGLAHVLALSGLHVGIIFALVSALLFSLRCLPAGRYIYYLSLAAAVMCYACVTGMAPSVARAAVMVLVFIATKLLQRSQSPYNSLCVAVSVWLLINPFWLWSPGLQLSVSAVLAIVWLGNLLNPFDHSEPGKRFVVSLFVIPIAAIIGTTMLTLCYFHSFPVWFLPTNIVAAILAPLIIGGGAIATSLTAIGVSAGYLPNVVNALYDFFEKMVLLFAEMPGGQLLNIYPNSWQIALYLICIGTLVYGIYKRRVAYYCMTAMFAVLLVATFVLKSDNRGSEMYVPRIAASTDILLRHDNRALLITNGDSIALDRASLLYADFLGKRGVQQLQLAPDTFAIGPFARTGKYVYFDNKILKIITSSRDVTRPIMQSTQIATSQTSQSAEHGSLQTSQLDEHSSSQAAQVASQRAAHIDYALVGGGFKGDILDVAGIVNPDTIILAHSINATRRRRYAAELTAAGVPVSTNPICWQK